MGGRGVDADDEIKQRDQGGGVVESLDQAGVVDDVHAGRRVGSLLGGFADLEAVEEHAG